MEWIGYVKQKRQSRFRQSLQNSSGYPYNR